ncbi:PAS domain-containing protein [Nostoc sp. CHAB 5844]|nr:PAS domain-containing protein [Nostoc sp. CHAB 5844]
MTQDRSTAEQMFVGKGEMAMRMRSLDWSQTPLGAVETWTQSLRSTLSICLNSRFPIAIYWGQESLLLYNDAWRPIVGDKHPWALGRPAREVWPEIWDDIGPELAGVLATGEGTFHNDELLSMYRFGYTEECFFEYTFNPIQGQGGVIDGVFNVVSETTYRVLNERRTRLLREAAKTETAKTAEEFCYLMVEAFKSDPFDIPFALLYLIDQDGKHARLCGSTDASDSSISPAVVDLTAADDTDSWAIALAARTGKFQEINDLESRFGKLPGSPWSEPPQEAMVLPIATTGQGKVTGVLVAVASPRRRLDDNYRDFFIQVVGQMAGAIANARAYEQERQRAEALVELDRAKTVFFSNISHEFRTPLTLMLSPLEELANTLDERLQPNEQEQLQLVQRNGLRLQKLVNTLLDFSRIEAGRVQAMYEPTDLAAFTSDLASVFRSLIEQAGLQLKVECPALPEFVYVDRDMWEKIVLNLLSNAFKFTFTGSITVRLRAIADQVELQVADTGVGIPRAELPRLFERFHRVSGTKSRTYEGSGIGLALVQELVKLHGGSIQVTSVLDQGTTFTVAIPLGSTHLPQEQIQTPRTRQSTALGTAAFVEEASRWLTEEAGEQRSRGAGEQGSLISPPPLRPSARILLADDNADMREYVTRLLSQYYEVVAVSDGMAAWEAIQERAVDLVLTDVMMPRLDGFGLLRQLREHPQTQEISIILLSARAGEESRIEGLEAGADDYLIKPFSARELLAKVEATLKLARLRQEAQARERTILKRVTDAFMALDREFRFTYANEAAQQVLQTPLEALLGRTMWECFPATVGAQFEFQYRRSLSEQVAVDFAEYYAPLDLWVEVHVYPSFTGLSIFFRDISDRKRTEQGEQFLGQLDARLRQLADADEMLWSAMSQVGEYLNVDRCLWHDVDLDNGLVIIKQDWRRQEIPSAVGIHQLSDFSLPDLLIQCQAGQTVVVSDVMTNPDTATFAQTYTSFDTRAFITVPCVYEGRWVASLVVNAQMVRDWRADEVALLQEVVSRLWSLIEHTRAVEKLRQSEAEFRQMANAMPQIVYVSNADGVLEFINDRWTEYTGLTLEQSRDPALMGQSIPLEDTQQLLADFAQAQKARSPYQSQFRLVQANGSYLYFLTRAVPLLDQQGQVRKWYGTSTEITGLKQLEAELRQKNAILDIVNESAPTPIFVKDRQGRIIYANPATLKVLGKTAQEVIGYRDCDLYANLEDAARVIENDRRIMESGQMEVVEESPDGIRTFLGMKVPYRNEAGEIVGLIGISNDITDRVQVERDRERILQQEQAAREAAENANRIKDEFLAVLSHELRSPLNPILGWTKLLQQGKLDAAKTQTALATIARNAQLQAQLIDDLLDISRILQGKLSLNIMPVDLSLVIAAALETVRLAAEAKLLQIQTTLPLTTRAVMGDAGRLQQVVWNLLSNAVKFTPPGGQITIALTQGATHAQIQVRDTGKGINPEFLPYVFEHFRQEDAATTRKFGGLGLGLAIARQIVELHGGTIAVESLGEDNGATFTVKLPLAKLSNPSSTETSVSTNNDLSGIYILVVDDEPDSREFVVFVLEQAGALVKSASSAIEALQAIEQFIPDLIVSDIGMPEMDGYMLMQQIRASEQGRQIPAIALTAYAGEFDRQQARASGFQRHLAKPVEPTTIIAVAAHLCGHKGEYTQ